jgi:hypothetical protein
VVDLSRTGHPVAQPQRGRACILALCVTRR